MSLEAQAKAYEQRLRAIIARAQAADARSMLEIRRRFTAFVAEVKRSYPAASELSRFAMQALSRDLAGQIDRLTADVQGIVRAGITAKEEVARELMNLYAATWMPAAHLSTTFLGMSSSYMHDVFDYTAGLIQSRQGGLAGMVQAQIDGALQRAMLGIDAKPQAEATISSALGLGDGWSYEAERIFRTETNRFMSLVTEQGIDALARTGEKVMKRWHWSGIARMEHARIHGQVVPADGFFRVPRKNGGLVEMPYPRAVVDRRGAPVPADATVNCGCFHCPIPAAAAAIPIPRPPVFTGSKKRVA